MKKMLVILLYLSSNSVIGQSTDLTQNTHTKFNIYADVSSWLVFNQSTISIERKIFTARDKISLYIKGGLGGVIIFYGTEGWGPLGGFTMLFGRGNNHLETAIGINYILAGPDIDANLIPMIDAGYRYQKPEGGLIFRAKAGIMGLGFGFGYAF